MATGEDDYGFIPVLGIMAKGIGLDPDGELLDALFLLAEFDRFFIGVGGSRLLQFLEGFNGHTESLWAVPTISFCGGGISSRAIQETFRFNSD